MLKSSPLIIVSMHRSGSSLVASLLQSAGLQIGERLMASARDNNVKGFFENLDFVEFHRDLLGSQGLNQDGWTREKKIKVDDLFIDRAKQLIAQNSTDTYWGWKDPRTTLFLKFWAELLPEAKFVMIFRSPWEVVDSLYRRGDPFFQAEPELAVKMWLHYNKKILKFTNSFPHKCLLANIRTIANDPGTWIEAVNQKFQTHLHTPDGNIYEPSLLKSQSTDKNRSALIEQHFPKATILYKALNALAWYPNSQAFTEQQLELSDRVSSDRSMFFADWRNLRALEMQNCDLEAQLQQAEAILKQSQAQICETQTALERSQTQLCETETVSEQSQAQLHETEIVLEQSQAQLHETEAVLEQSQTELQNARVQLHQTEAVLAQSQSQLQQTETVLEQSLLHNTRTELQFQHRIEGIFLDRVGSDQVNRMQYDFLVWSAWHAYQIGDLSRMREKLQQSTRLSSFTGAENILHWLDRFRQFSAEQGEQFNASHLTGSEEWKLLVYRATNRRLVGQIQ
jgi:hypothetical protein